MINIAIVDDDPVFAQQIKEIVVNCFLVQKELVEVKVYVKPKELLWDLEDHISYDIYLIDIEMPSIDGMQLAQEIRCKYEEPYIIFVTSYVQYCIQGYEYNVYRYITKESVGDKLPVALEGIARKIKTKESKQYIIESASKIVKIEYEDIYYLHIDSKYTYFVSRTGTFRVRKPLSRVYGELSATATEFVFTDKSYVINLRHVLELRERVIIMRGGEEIPVSIPQLQKVKKAISAYWRMKL